MPRGRPPTTSGASARQPSQRRAAMLKRAAESAPSVPAPQARRRCQVSAAAGRPDEVDHPVVTSEGLQPTAGTSTVEMVAIVTREVLRHLREERAVAPLPVAVPAVPVPVLPVEIPVVPHPAEQMDGGVAGAINSLLQGGCSTTDGALASTAANKNASDIAALAPVMTHLLNAAISDSTKQAYRRAILTYADFIRNLGNSPQYAKRFMVK
ncbi:hypothetical protein LSAT2_010596 [Lamellibrachia satsuma]|nr:hypothetical protein LSAT2_010596 [Lamellibrachia satsuma]